ncbi:hypothetical protein [Leptospira wolffii]|nr:hypothetical protein [Leptospira wolffii]EPG66163.1 hypothetical protein LEP1GSC061_4089 [Leptospira wolffii serovar Khorat str. Khorat-H2]
MKIRKGNRLKLWKVYRIIRPALAILICLAFFLMIAYFPIQR